MPPAGEFSAAGGEPSPPLWLGVLERLFSGLEKGMLVVVHRLFLPAYSAVRIFLPIRHMFSLSRRAAAACPCKPHRVRVDSEHRQAPHAATAWPPGSALGTQPATGREGYKQSKAAARCTSRPANSPAGAAQILFTGNRLVDSVFNNHSSAEETTAALQGKNGSPAGAAQVLFSDKHPLDHGALAGRRLCRLRLLAGLRAGVAVHAHASRTSQQRCGGPMDARPQPAQA